jgi:hypothetical protein
MSFSVVRFHERAAQDIEIEHANVSRSYRGTVIAEALPRTVLAMIALCRDIAFLTGAAAVVLVMATPPVASLVAPLRSRSSHCHMLQRASSPRAYAEYVW